MIVVTATMITIVEYTSDVRIPAVTPTPATINPTSPLDIIPIPTLMPCALLFKNHIAGNPHPNNFVTTATTMTAPLSIKIFKSTALRSTCAHIMAKNSGAKIKPIFPT